MHRLLGSMLILAAMAMTVGAPRAEAVPIYSASATACTSESKVSTGPVTAQVSPTSCGGVAGAAYAAANEFGLHGDSSYTHYCCQTASGAQSSASVSTDFMITGPAGLVTTSLNLVLHGSMGGGISDDESTRQIEMHVNVAGYAFAGVIAEMVRPPNGISYYKAGNLVIPGTTCATPCHVPTQEVTLQANTQYAFSMQLITSTGGGTGDSSGWANAHDTLYFPLDGPVFNLPDGYSAVIYGLSVEGNRVAGLDTGDGGGQVPEPATSAMAGGGLALAALLRRRKKGRERPAS